MDFKPYDDILDVVGYEGFIDRNGNFYKVGLKRKKSIKDTHNEWAEKFMKEKLNVKDFKFNPTTSALLTLTTLSGPAEILVHCFGYVYYSHDLLYYSPIIKLPDPKVSNYKVTQEQLDTLYLIMKLHRENTDIPIFNDDDEYNYDNDNDYEYQYMKK